MTTALLLIDIQNDYFPNGKFPLPDMSKVSLICSEILHSFRQKNLPIVHIQHIFSQKECPFFCAHTEGSQIHESVAPLLNETVIVKEFPNSFYNTHLHDHLQSINCDRIVIIGAMTQMCVDATARAALEHDYAVTICADAIAAQEVHWKDKTLTPDDVNAVFLSALAMANIHSAPSSELLNT